MRSAALVEEVVHLGGHCLRERCIVLLGESGEELGAEALDGGNEK